MKRTKWEPSAWRTNAWYQRLPGSNDWNQIKPAFYENPYVEIAIDAFSTINLDQVASLDCFAYLCRRPINWVATARGIRFRDLSKGVGKLKDLLTREPVAFLTLNEFREDAAMRILKAYQGLRYRDQLFNGLPTECVQLFFGRYCEQGGEVANHIRQMLENDEECNNRLDNWLLELPFGYFDK